MERVVGDNLRNIVAVSCLDNIHTRVDLHLFGTD